MKTGSHHVFAVLCGGLLVLVMAAADAQGQGRRQRDRGERGQENATPQEGERGREGGEAQRPTAMPPSSGDSKFDAFKLVRTRNIFDPARQANRPEQPREAPRTNPRPDYAALTGTMVTPEKSVAFFSGSRAEYNKVLQVQGTIAGATVTRIGPNDVEIDRSGAKTTLLVGQALPLGEGNSAPVDASTFNTQAAGASGAAPGQAASSQSNPPAPSASGSGPEDIRARMMRQRQQETSK